MKNSLLKPVTSPKRKIFLPIPAVQQKLLSILTSQLASSVMILKTVRLVHAIWSKRDAKLHTLALTCLSLNHPPKQVNSLLFKHWRTSSLALMKLFALFVQMELRNHQEITIMLFRLDSVSKHLNQSLLPSKKNTEDYSMEKQPQINNFL